MRIYSGGYLSPFADILVDVESPLDRHGDRPPRLPHHLWVYVGKDDRFLLVGSGDGQTHRVEESRVTPLYGERTVNERQNGSDRAR
jgi:hypothetical protein